MHASLITHIVQQLLVLEILLYYHFTHYKNLVRTVLITDASDETSLYETALKKEDHHFLLAIYHTAISKHHFNRHVIPIQMVYRNFHLIIKWPTCEEKTHHRSGKKSPTDSSLDKKLLSRHTVVCQQPRKQKKMCGTQVCYLLVPQSCQIQPSVSPKLLSRFLPNLYMSCLSYTLLHISNLKEITSAVLEIFVPKNCPIFFTFFFFTQNYKYILSRIKITFPCCNFSQIWNTYKAH